MAGSVRGAQRNHTHLTIGVVNLFGIAWFAGSAVMGFVYERSTFALVILSVVLQLAALPFLSIAVRREGEAA